MTQQQREATPGPWSMEEATYLIGRKLYDATIYDDEGTVLANVRALPSATASKSSHDESVANARLLAAAPDLLAACEAALPLLIAAHPITGPSGLYFDNLKAIDQLCAAITKARGEAGRDEQP